MNDNLQEATADGVERIRSAIGAGNIPLPDLAVAVLNFFDAVREACAAMVQAFVEWLGSPKVQAIVRWLRHNGVPLPKITIMTRKVARAARIAGSA